MQSVPLEILLMFGAVASNQTQLQHANVWASQTAATMHGPYQYDQVQVECVVRAGARERLSAETKASCKIIVISWWTVNMLTNHLFRKRASFVPHTHTHMRRKTLWYSNQLCDEFGGELAIRSQTSHIAMCPLFLLLVFFCLYWLVYCCMAVAWAQH